MHQHGYAGWERQPFKLLLIHYFFFFSQSLFYFIYVWLCWVFVAAWALSLFGSAWGLLSHCGVQVSHCGLVLLWRTGIMVPWQMGSLQTGDRTHVSCVGR